MTDETASVESLRNGTCGVITNGSVPLFRTHTVSVLFPKEYDVIAKSGLMVLFRADWRSILEATLEVAWLNAVEVVVLTKVLVMVLVVPPNCSAPQYPAAPPTTRPATSVTARRLLPFVLDQPHFLNMNIVGVPKGWLGACLDRLLTLGVDGFN